MRLRRRRQPDPVITQVITTPVSEVATVAPSKPKLSKPEPSRPLSDWEQLQEDGLRQAAILAELAKTERGTVEATQAEADARRVWEEGRRHLRPEPFNADGRFVY